MKHLFTSSLILAFLTSFSIFTGLDDIINGIKRGDAALLASYFDNTVDLTLPGKTNSYSKSQAQMVLRDFFDANQVQGFDIIQRGENNSVRYCVGTLRTPKSSFLTTVFLKARSGKTVLQELRIEKK